MPPLVFLSYASPDHDKALIIRNDLESDGIACWMASRDILGSEDYVRKIPAAIEDARILLLVVSTSSLASDHVYSEVHLAIDAKKQILPVRVEQIDAIEGQLRYPLAGRQWIDATPRVEPALGHIRSEVRRLLKAQGIVVVPLRQSPFRRAIIGATAWIAVGALTFLVMLVVRAYWINLVRLEEVPMIAARSPLLLAVLLAVPILAIGLQYFANRHLRSVLTLDALFALGPLQLQRAQADESPAGRHIGKRSRAPLVRTAVAASAALALFWAVRQAPATIRLVKVDGSPAVASGIHVTPVQECSTTYYKKSSYHYDVGVRIGAYNPPGNYVLRVEIAYQDPDSVNFCDFWASPELQISKSDLDPQWDDTLAPNRSRFIEIERSRDAFTNSSHLLFTLVHPRRAPPNNSVTWKARIGRGNYAVNSAAIRIVQNEWSE